MAMPVNVITGEIPRIMTPKKTYTFDYPKAEQYAQAQRDVFWPPDEIGVEKDVHSLKTEATASEYHGIITTLKLFTMYELIIGNEYWLGKVMKWFPRPDIEMMANCFGFFEINVHAPFYSRINKALMLDTDEFYSSYVDDPILNDRMSFIDSIVDNDDPLLSLGAFSMTEGAILYSNFAFLKHFQSQGKNKMVNIVRGINFSVRDENLHSEAGAWLYRTLADELGMTKSHLKKTEQQIQDMAQKVFEHESRIIDMTFEKGPMDGINAAALKAFVKSRINLCLNQLNIESIFEVPSNPVADWFYDGINSIQFHDSFSGVGSEYNRKSDETRYIWTPESSAA